MGPGNEANLCVALLTLVKVHGLCIAHSTTVDVKNFGLALEALEALEA